MKKKEKTWENMGKGVCSWGGVPGKYIGNIHEKEETSANKDFDGVVIATEKKKLGNWASRTLVKSDGKMISIDKEDHRRQSDSIPPPERDLYNKIDRDRDSESWVKRTNGEKEFAYVYKIMKFF